MFISRLHEALRDMLVDAGVNGIKKKYLTHGLMHLGNADEIQAILNEWFKVGAVQKFTIQGAHRPATVWRATEKILTLQDGIPEP